MLLKIKKFILSTSSSENCCLLKSMCFEDHVDGWECLLRSTELKSFQSLPNPTSAHHFYVLLPLRLLLLPLSFSFLVHFIVSCISLTEILLFFLFFLLLFCSYLYPLLPILVLLLWWGYILKRRRTGKRRNN